MHVGGEDINSFLGKMHGHNSTYNLSNSRISMDLICKLDDSTVKSTLESHFKIIKEDNQ